MATEPIVPPSEFWIGILLGTALKKITWKSSAFIWRGWWDYGLALLGDMLSYWTLLEYFGGYPKFC